MPVEINELVTEVHVADDAGLLQPSTLQKIVKAVLEALKSAETNDRNRRSDLDTRSIVEQQRGGKR